MDATVVPRYMYIVPLPASLAQLPPMEQMNEGEDIGFSSSFCSMKVGRMDCEIDKVLKRVGVGIERMGRSYSGDGDRYQRLERTYKKTFVFPA